MSYNMGYTLAEGKTVRLGVSEVSTVSRGLQWRKRLQMEEDLLIENAMNADDSTQKTLPVDKVNQIVAREKLHAANQARREVEAEYQRKMEEMQASQARNEPSERRDVDVNSIYQQVAERLTRESQEKQLQAEMSHVANSYLMKMQQGREQYGEEFDRALADFDPSSFPKIVYLVAGMDNAADVMLDLAQNPMKLASIDSLAEKSPKTAQMELAKLAASITANKQALMDAENQKTPEPLNRLQPTTVSGGNGGAKSIKDLRSQPWLRG